MVKSPLKSPKKKKSRYSANNISGSLNMSAERGLANENIRVANQDLFVSDSDSEENFLKIKFSHNKLEGCSAGRSVHPENHMQKNFHSREAADIKAEQREAFLPSKNSSGIYSFDEPIAKTVCHDMDSPQLVRRLNF